MKRIYSKLDSEKLVLGVIRYGEISEYRTDLSPDEEYLQVSGRRLTMGTRVGAHKHIPIDRNTDVTQEAWIVFQGCIKGTFYDLDDSFLYETEIREGDIVVLYRGGHALEVLEEDTVFYELKTGPYYGEKADKLVIAD
jgi:hypothetical protein